MKNTCYLVESDKVNLNVHTIWCICLSSSDVTTHLKVGSCPNNDKSVQYLFLPFLCSI